MRIDYVQLFNEVAFDCGLDPFTRFYCLKRLRSPEGISFLTVTLPKLSKAVLRSLELGYFERPTDFAWKGKSLRFFRSFLDRIFDKSSGKVLEEVDALALWQCRQLCEYFYKLSLDFPEAKLQESEDKFVKTDSELNADVDFAYVDRLRKDFETHMSAISTSVPLDVFQSNGPRAGSGTFSGSSVYNKTVEPWYLRRLNDSSPDYMCPGFEGFYKPYKNAPSSAPVPYIDYSEVLFVPKDSRGPRTIVREPFTALKSQLSFFDWFTRQLNHYSSGRINFQDQQVNRELARVSSVTKEWATLDLKDASDRVSYKVVSHIYRHSPAVSYFVNRRTKRAKLPSGKFITLNKLAGMGSGLTFPILSHLVYLASVRAIVNNSTLTYTQAMKLVYVYGDDLIVPTKYIACVRDSLGKISLVVNEQKSFSTSFFRESCGGDFYYGQSVSPVRLKLSGSKIVVKDTFLYLDPNSKVGNNSLSLVNVERHCRELVRNGLVGTAEYLYTCIEKRYGKLPTVSGNSPVIGRFSLIPKQYETDVTGAYHRVRCILPVPDTRKYDTCPYIYIGSLLTRSLANSVLDFLTGTVGSTYGDVACPRRIKLKRANISAFRLIG